MSSASFSIIVPARNEAQNLRILLPEISRTLRGYSGSYEILVIDDGSNDDTESVLTEARREESRIRGLILEEHQGKGTALAVGVRQATGDIMVTMDGDGQDDPAMIPRLLAKIDEGADLVLGRRDLRQDVWQRRFISIFANTALACFFGMKRFRDCNTGFRAYRREVALRYPLADGMFRFSAFILSAAGKKVTDVSVVHRKRLHGKTHFSLLRRLDTIYCALFTRFRISRGIHPRDDESLRIVAFREIR